MPTPSSPHYAHRSRPRRANETGQYATSPDGVRLLKRVRDAGPSDNPPLKKIKEDDAHAKAGQYSTYEASESSQGIITDTVLLPTPTLGIHLNASTQKSPTPLVSNDDLQDLIQTGKGYNGQRVDLMWSPAANDPFKNTLPDAKKYSEVQVLVIRWKKSGFDDEEEDLEQQLRRFMRTCHRYYWEPERFAIPEGNSSKCTRALSATINEFVSRCGGTSAHLLVLLYSGHSVLHPRNGKLLLAGEEDATIVWNDIQETVQHNTRADVLFFLDACYSAAALRQHRSTLWSLRRTLNSRQDLIAASAREGTAPTIGSGVITNIWVELLRTYIHGDMPQTTDSLNTKANELKRAKQSFVRITLSEQTPPIPLEPCYSALHKLVENFYTEDIRKAPPTQFLVVFVQEGRSYSSCLRSEDTTPFWLCKGTTVAECKARCAEVCKISEERLSLKAGPLFPEDTQTLSYVHDSIVKHYTHATNLIVLEAFWDYKALYDPTGREKIRLKCRRVTRSTARELR